MAVTVTTGTGSASLVSTYYDKLGLERLLANTVMYGLATKKKLPKNQGTQVIFHRYYNLSNTVSAAKLTEGSAPTAGLLSSTPVSATLEQYGTTIQVSDLLEMTAVSDVVEDAVMQLGEQAAQIVDLVTEVHVKLGYMLENPSILRYVKVIMRQVRTISREVFVTPQRLHAEPLLLG